MLSSFFIGQDRADDQQPATGEDLAALRAEIAALRADVAARAGHGRERDM